MLDKSSYVPYGLEPIETASRDEITALQTQRLKWTLKHAYDNVAGLSREVRCRRRAPGRFPADRRSREISIHDQA